MCHLVGLVHRLLFDCTQIEQRRLNWKAESKVGSLEKVKSLFILRTENMKIMKCSRRQEILHETRGHNNPNQHGFTQATHRAGGGDVKIENRKLDWKAESKVDNHITFLNLVVITRLGFCATESTVCDCKMFVLGWFNQEYEAQASRRRRPNI